MAPVTGVTEFSNSLTLGNLRSRIYSPQLVKSVVMMNLMYTEELPRETNVKKFGKKGGVTAATVVEATALAIDTNGEITDGNVAATVAKAAISSGLSVELTEMGTIDVARMIEEHAAAHARFFDNDALGMFTGLTNGVTSTSVMTVDDLMLGQFNIYNSNCPNPEVPLVAVLGPRAVYNLQKDIVQAGASVWSNPAMLSVLGGAPQANGFRGSFPFGVQVFSTTGFGTSGGDDIQAVFHPMWTFAAVVAAAPRFNEIFKGSEGFYTEVTSYFMFDVIEWNDTCGTKLLSDT